MRFNYLILEPSHAVHQYLCKTYYFVKVFLKILYFIYCCLLHFLRNLSLSFLNRSLNFLQHGLILLNFFHMLSQLLVNKVKVFLRLSWVSIVMFNRIIIKFYCLFLTHHHLCGIFILSKSRRLKSLEPTAAVFYWNLRV